MLISMVIPCYNEEESLPYLKEALINLKSNIPDYTMEVILIDDGSKDRTKDIIKAFSKEDSSFRYIILSRNFGKESAMLAGMEFAHGDIIGIMDSDLQHSPDMIPVMLKAIEDGYDVAATHRTKRDASTSGYNRFARKFYTIMNRYSDDIKIVEGAQDFRLMKRQVVEAIIAQGEYYRFSKGIFSWVGFNTKWFEAKDNPRIAGKTKWNFISSSKYAINGILSFSTVPLRLSFIIGSLFSLIGFLYVIYIILRTIFVGVDTPGFATIVCIQLITSGILLLSIGVIGEYIARIYNETKGRSHYIVKESNLEVYNNER